MALVGGKIPQPAGADVPGLLEEARGHLVTSRAFFRLEIAGHRFQTHPDESGQFDPLSSGQGLEPGFFRSRDLDGQRFPHETKVIPEWQKSITFPPPATSTPFDV